MIGTTALEAFENLKEGPGTSEPSTSPERIVAVAQHPQRPRGYRYLIMKEVRPNTPL